MTTHQATDIPVEQVRPHDLVRVVSETRIPDGWPLETVTAMPRFQLLHRPRPKPPVGTILTGKQVKSRQWKRGTLFCLIKHSTLANGHRCQASKLYSITQLTRDGQFMVSENDVSLPTIIGDDAEFILVYRPEEESDRVSDS